MRVGPAASLPWSVLLALLLLACPKPKADSKPDAVSASDAAQPMDAGEAAAAEPVPDASPSEPADAGRSPMWPAPSVGPPDAARVACGKSVCNPRYEVCCGKAPLHEGEGVESGHCELAGPVAVDAGEGEEFTRYRAVASACGEGDDALALCDDSSDCGPSGMCCSGLMLGMRWPSVRLCVHASNPGERVACRSYEACAPGKACRTPGTTCRSGRCVVTTARVPCGSVTCGGARNVCCATERDGGRARHQCMAAEECTSEHGPSISCAGASDCPLGNFCVNYQVSVRCGGDWFNGPVLCRSKSECPPARDGLTLRGCEPVGADSNLPPGLSVCAYRE